MASCYHLLPLSQYGTPQKRGTADGGFRGVGNPTVSVSVRVDFHETGCDFPVGLFSFLRVAWIRSPPSCVSDGLAARPLSASVYESPLGGLDITWGDGFRVALLLGCVVWFSLIPGGVSPCSVVEVLYPN